MEDEEDGDSGGRSSITKKTIVKKLAQEMNLPQGVVRDLVDRVFDAITDALVINKRLELRNFGVFEVKQRAPRMGRNPRTLEEVQIGSRVSVSFKQGKIMEERLRRLIAEQEPLEDDDR